MLLMYTNELDDNAETHISCFILNDSHLKLLSTNIFAIKYLITALKQRNKLYQVLVLSSIRNFDFTFNNEITTFTKVAEYLN